MTLQDFATTDMNASAFLALAALLPGADAPAGATVAKGEIRFACPDDRHNVPERFRLAPHTFAFEDQFRYDLRHSDVEVRAVRFASPVASPHAENNTVHCEYFRPKKPGKYPAVIVLDILQGNALVSRGEAVWLASNGIAALTVTMPYYGARRPPEATHGKQRMLTPDVTKSVDNVCQTVLDCRRAAAWLAAQPEVDAGKLGVLGTSLGSFVGGVVAAVDPTIKTGCLLLGGGGLVDVFWDHPQAGLLTRGLQVVGITREQLKDKLAVVDPLTYADRLKEKKLLLIAASRDDVVPPEAMKRLWEATGKPKLVWVDSTHVGAAAFAFKAMNEVIAHLKD
jgi:dienelactone hydrolase